MTELAQHIENLLLENDCVILPGLGGFVAHYAPSTRSADDANRFLPPVRVVGFNPRLTMNDGLLAQSFMGTYHTNFPDASRMVEQHVERLVSALHEDGKADLANVGELRYTIEGKYNFTPSGTQLTTPSLYGLGSFELAPLGKRPAPEATPARSMTSARGSVKRSVRRAGMRRAMTTLSVLVAVVLMALCPSAPVGNTEPAQGNYARLLPTDIIEQLEKQSVALTPVATTRKEPAPGKKRTPVVPKAVKEIKVPKAVATEAPKATPAVAKEAPEAVATEAPKTAPASSAKPAKRYCIIVASLATRADAEAQAASMRAQGHPEAEAIITEGKRRVSIARYATQPEAYKALGSIREQKGFEGAWVLKQ